MMPIDQELMQLTAKALHSDEAVNRLEGDGVTVEVDHWPEAGIERCVRKSGSTSAADWVGLRLAPVDTRPRLYPDSLPFVPNAGAVLWRSGDATTVTWRPPDGPSCQIVPDEPPEALNDVTAQLIELHRESKRQGKASAEMADDVSAVFESLDPDTLAELERFWESLRVDSKTEEWLTSVFDAVVAASRDEGWLETMVQKPDKPVPFRFVVMKHSGTQRTVMMQAMSGAMVLLSEQPAKEAEPA